MILVIAEVSRAAAGDAQPLYDRGAPPGKPLKVSGLVPDPFLVAGGRGGWMGGTPSPDWAGSPQALLVQGSLS